MVHKDNKDGNESLLLRKIFVKFDICVKNNKIFVSIHKEEILF